jgi:hypothetical protein
MVFTVLLKDGFIIARGGGKVQRDTGGGRAKTKDFMIS